MTLGGWIIMIISVSAVTVFFGWTLFLVLTRKPDLSEIHSTMEETPDVED